MAMYLETIMYHSSEYSLYTLEAMS